MKIMHNHDLSQYRAFFDRLMAMAKAATVAGNQLPTRHGYFGEEDEGDDDWSWNSTTLYGDDDGWHDYGWEDWDDWQDDDEGV